MKKRHFIRIGTVMVILGIMSFSDWTFAADGDKLGLLNEVSKLLHIAVSILSWIWVFFAQGAGEFLSNKWVYGEVLGLDVVLWKYWNVVKNIANFGLGFYFIYIILKSLISSSILKTLKSTLLWILVAGIGIQVSWFITAVVLDISTITLATAGSFPSMVISEVEEVDDGFELSIENYLKIKGSIDEIKSGINFSLFSSAMGVSNFITVKDIELKEPMTKKEVYDTIMPNADNVSGPLYYLGFFILKVTTIVSPSSSDEKGWMSTIFNTLLQGGTTIVFSIEMLVLLIVAVIRLLYMWVFIVLSPIVVLLTCIRQCEHKGGSGESFLDGLMKHFNLTSFFRNAFKPTLIVLAFSVVMVFMTLMNKVIISNGDKEFDMLGMKASRRIENVGPKTGNDGDQQYITIMDGDYLEITIRRAGKTIFNFILSIITVILVYVIIKFAVKMGGGTDFLSKSIEKLQGIVERGIGAMPLVPVRGWDKNGKPETHYISAGRAFGFGMNKNDGNLLSYQMNKWTKGVKDVVSQQTDSLNNLLGWTDSKRMNQSDWNKIENAGKLESLHGLELLNEKKKAITKTETGWGFMLNPNKGDARWINEFKEWLKKTAEEGGLSSRPSGVSPVNYDVWKKMVERWKVEDNQKRSLQDMFIDIPNSAKVYAEFFGLNKKIGTWLELQDEDISKSGESE